MENKIIEKLRKLIRLGESPNVHEAELAMQKALELAQENGIELSKISTKVEESSITEESLQFGQRMPIVSDYVFKILLKFFNVKVLYTGNRVFGRGAILAGTAENIIISKFVFNFLSDAMDRTWKNYYNSNNIKLSERKNFFHGFFNGLKQKLENQKKEVETQNSSLALMVVNNEKAIQNYLDSKFGEIKTAKSYKKTYLTEAYLEGREAGQNTNIPRGAIDGPGTQKFIN